MFSTPSANSSDFEQLSGSDHLLAEEAFTRLWNETRPKLGRWVRSKSLPVDQSDDLLQAVAARLWNSRSSFEVPSMASWWRLCCRVTTNLMIDEARKNASHIDLQTEDEIPDVDLPYIDVILAAASDRDRVFRLADSVWLGKVGAVSEPESNLNLLVAQMFFVDRMSVSEIQKALNLSSNVDVDSVLADPNIIRRLAYHELYVCNDALAGIVLRPQQPYDSKELDVLAREAYRRTEMPPEGWTWDDVQLAIWRIRNGLLTDQILRSEICRQSKSEIEAKFAAWRERYPFARIASQLMKALLPTAHIDCLKATGLWRRLVFQYHAVDELSYKQILERTDPAADVIGLVITEARLTGWIGMGRLWSQLAAAYEAGGFDAS